MARRIVYEMKDGSEQKFWIDTVEQEQHERAQAERELHSRDTQQLGYHFENVGFPVPDEQVTVDTPLIISKRHPHTGN